MLKRIISHLTRPKTLYKNGELYFTDAKHYLSKPDLLDIFTCSYQQVIQNRFGIWIKGQIYIGRAWPMKECHEHD